MNAVKCCAVSWDAYMRRGTPCGKPAKVEHKGKPYCGIHNPARAEARNAKWNVINNAKNALYDAQSALRKVEREALDYLLTTDSDGAAALRRAEDGVRLAQRAVDEIRGAK